MENGRKSKGIKNELVHAYKQYLQKTRDDNHIQNMPTKNVESNSDSQDVIKRNFSRLREEFQHAINALEQQYMCQYQQLTELKTAVDIEKSDILKTELKKMRIEFDTEILAKRAAWEKEEEKYVMQQKEREEVEKIYQQNKDLWVSEIENFEKQKEAREAAFEDRERLLIGEFERRKRDCERLIGEEEFKFETRKAEMESELEEWKMIASKEIAIKNSKLQQKEELFYDLKEREEEKLNNVRDELQKKLKSLESFEEELKIKRAAILEKEETIIKKYTQMEEEEKEYRRRMALRLKTDQTQYEQKKEEAQKAIDNTKRKIEMELKLKIKQLEERELQMRQKEDDQDALEQEIVGIPEKMKRVAEEVHQKVKKELIEEFQKRLKMIKEDQAAEIKLNQQMNELLEVKINEKNKKIDQLTRHIAVITEKSQRIVVNAVDKIAKVSNNSVRTHSNSIPKIVRSHGRNG